MVAPSTSQPLRDAAGCPPPKTTGDELRFPTDDGHPHDLPAPCSTG